MTADGRDDGQAPSKDMGRCGAKRRQGDGTCGLDAGWGTDHVGIGRCRKHGGNTTKQRIGAERQRVAAQIKAVVSAYHLDVPEGMTSGEALEGELLRSRQVVAWLERQVRELDGADGVLGIRGAELVDRYQGERQHLARVAKDIRSLNLDDRRVDLAERYADQVVDLVGRLAVAWGLDPTDPVVQDAAERVLRALPPGA